MAVELPGGILRQTDIRETITNTAETSVAYDLDFLRFDQKGTIVGTQGIYISPDGTKVYSGDTQNIRYYSLSPGWDISTLSLIHTLDVSAKETSIQGVFFKPDGKKMYTLGDTGDSIDEYDLSTAWDLSTAVYLQEFDISGEDTTITGFWIREDGKQVYFMGSLNDKIFAYHLNTAWDITTAENLDNVAAHTDTKGISLSRDGLHAFLDIASTMKRYVMTSPFRISTMTLDTTLTVFPSAAQNAKYFFFKENGTKLFISSNAGEVFQYSIKRGWK